MGTPEFEKQKQLFMLGPSWLWGRTVDRNAVVFASCAQASAYCQDKGFGEGSEF